MSSGQLTCSESWATFMNLKQNIVHSPAAPTDAYVSRPSNTFINIANSQNAQPSCSHVHFTNTEFSVLSYIMLWREHFEGRGSVCCVWPLCSYLYQTPTGWSGGRSRSPSGRRSSSVPRQNTMDLVAGDSGWWSLVCRSLCLPVKI